MPDYVYAYPNEDMLAEYALKESQAAEDVATIATNTTTNNVLLTNLVLQENQDKSAIMTSSIASVLDDSTPSDSGVQLLDSVSSSGLNESIMSNSGFDFDISPCPNLQDFQEISPGASAAVLPDLLMQANEPNNKPYTMTKSDIDNSNIDIAAQLCTTTKAATNEELDPELIPDAMKTSTCSTFDTENIVYRRKVKKARPPKKRVSFHEDILKNTKTDNIHIEHGFITYKGHNKKHPQIARYSWCSEGGGGGGGTGNSDAADDEYMENNQYYYRNACSDVLAYGKTDIYEKDVASIQYDNSGVFEYAPQTLNGNIQQQQQQMQQQMKNNEFYKCNCSDSNSSLDSGDSNDNIVKRNYGQAKSNSCDCIGITQASNQNTSINENCYFSEPSIETLDDSFEHIKPKSVWSKEKKPKSSCLKSVGRRHTHVIEEYDISTKVKTFNVHQLPDMNNLIDNSKNIFGSLKNIFAMPLPERGVPEGCEDLQSVYECVPEVETYSPVHKPRPFLSKSFDGGLFNKKNDKPKKYVHNVDEQLRHKHENKDVAQSLESTTTTTDLPPNQSTSSAIKSQPVEEFVDLINECQPTQQQASPNTFRNKYIINCESTVFEHTGVSYENDNVLHTPISSIYQPNTTQATPVTNTTTSFIPFRQKLTNIIKSFRDSSSNFDASINTTTEKPQEQVGSSIYTSKQPISSPPVLPKQTVMTNNSSTIKTPQNIFENDIPMSMDSSIISDISMSTTTTTHSSHDRPDVATICNSPSPSQNKYRHLISPVHKKSLTTRFERCKMSPDLFGCGRESKCTLSEEFDDILTITTTTEPTDSNDSDLVIVDYPEENGGNNLLKPPSGAKSSLINRFLRNVTQKKIHDATIKKNSFLAAKMKNDKKLFENIYVKGVRPRNPDLIEDLNAEIALEIELSGCAGSVTSNMQKFCEAAPIKNEFGLGVGEISVDIFATKRLHIFRDDREILMKVSKYTYVSP